MAECYPPALQRPRLIALAGALTALRRDECGDWRITGRRGHIYAVCGARGDFLRESRQAWTWAKKLMRFCAVAQDGDTEGMLLMPGRLDDDYRLAAVDGVVD